MALAQQRHGVIWQGNCACGPIAINLNAAQSKDVTDAGPGANDRQRSKPPVDGGRPFVMVEANALIIADSFAVLKNTAC